MTVNDTMNATAPVPEESPPDLSRAPTAEAEPTIRSLLAKRIRHAKSRVEEALRADEGDAASEHAQVFVSYSSEDGLVDCVYDDLVSWGYSVWLDKVRIPGAVDYSEAISKAIRDTDVFMLLLSPNVGRQRAWVFRELKLAQDHNKKIVPVRLRDMSMPDGFDLRLVGLQVVDLTTDWDVGMEQLVDALGEPQRQPPANLRSGLLRAKSRMRRISQQHEFARMLKVFGAGSLATVAAAIAVARKRQELQQDAERQREMASVAEYIARTDELLGRAVREVHYTVDMSAREYRDEFRPRFMQVLGALEELRPPTVELVEYHRKLTERLKDLLHEFEALAASADEPESASRLRTAARWNAAWTEAITSSRSWLDEAMKQYAQLAAPVQ